MGEFEPPEGSQNDFADRVASIAALAEPARRVLYQFVVGQPDPVSRDEAAAGVGVPRHVAKFHLDKLVDDGLLDFEFRRPPGRRGPGAGRPSKVYRRAVRDVAVSVPERHYELAARLMAEALTRSQRTSDSVTDTLRDAARQEGHALAERVGSRRHEDLKTGLMVELENLGFEPRSETDGIVMVNCPFRSLASDYTDLVCGMNLDIMRGALDQIPESGLQAELRPQPGRCCVTLTSRR